MIGTGDSQRRSLEIGNLSAVHQSLQEPKPATDTLPGPGRNAAVGAAGAGLHRQSSMTKQSGRL